MVVGVYEYGNLLAVAVVNYDPLDLKIALRVIGNMKKTRNFGTKWIYLRGFTNVGSKVAECLVLSAE